MSRAWVRFAILLLLLPMAASAQQPGTTTTLKSSSATLQLPGSLNLTATVAPAAGSAGMPSGSVQFFSNKTDAIGTEPLIAIPSTESFSTQATSGTLGDLPYGIFTLPAGATQYSTLGVLDYRETGVTAVFYNPQLTIYSGQGTNLFGKSAVYEITNSNITNPNQGVDAFAVADFNHDGVPDVLIHGFSPSTKGNEYYVLPGKAGGTYDPTTSVISPDNSGLVPCLSCTESIAVDDFNGDGYPDVAYAGNPVTSGLIGVALNGGAGNPASFTTFKTAPAVTGSNVAFTPDAIATGHFTASGHADMVVGGYFESTTSTGELALFTGNGDGTFANPVTFQTANRPIAIATADFRQNGMTDVAVANVSFLDTTANSIQVFFGNGAGSLAVSSTVNYCSSTTGSGASENPASLLVKDFNNDGFPDILGTGTAGTLCLMLNDGTGHFSTATIIGQSLQAASMTATGDFNGDGLADIVQLTEATIDGNVTQLSSASEYLNSASSQAVLATAPQTVPAGTDTLTATFPANANFATSTSPGVLVTVTQTPTSLTWPTPAAIEYGTPLGSAQLDATASVAGVITYSPAAGTVLLPGANKVTATFVPTDNFNFAGVIGSQTITVTAPSMIAIAPSSSKLGAGNTTLTVTGQGFVKGATVEWNGTALATTWVSLNELTAIVPAALLTAKGTSTITVADPNGVAVTGSQTFTIIAQDAVATASAKATVNAGESASLTLTVNPYPVALTATLDLKFTPDPPNTVVDPTVVFSNNKTTETIQIPANSTAAIPPVDFSTGSTAGTITLTITLTADGADVTPATLTPVVVAVPAAAPVITSATLSSSGTTLTVAILGLSSTREMSQATFHFTAAAGQSLTTTDLTVDLTSAFGGWYSSAASDRFGTTFLYTQLFTLSSDASSVGSVSVTLTNSQGTSQSVSAQ
jgi:hypothetical protein